LNEAGKKLYDMRGAADAYGPGAIRLYSPPVVNAMTGLNDYLRNKSGLEPRLVELAILITAREMDSEYVWTAHEPAAQKAGLAQDIIDTVKHRRPLTKMGEKEAVIVQLGRDAISKHKVGSAATTILLNVSDQRVRPREKSLLPIP